MIASWNGQPLIETQETSDMSLRRGMSSTENSPKGHHDSSKQKSSESPGPFTRDKNAPRAQLFYSSQSMEGGTLLPALISASLDLDATCPESDLIMVSRKQPQQPEVENPVMFGSFAPSDLRTSVR